MTEAEVEFVAEELAKVGGTSWYPGRQAGPLLRVVTDRYRDRARVAIKALDRFRAAEGLSSDSDRTATNPHAKPANQGNLLSPDVRVGAIVIYRPPGDRRAFPCQVDRIEDGQAYLVPLPAAGTYAVPLADLLPSAGAATPLDPQST